MRVLSLSSVYPNDVQPGHGVFVRQRLQALARNHDVTVVAPVPGFPFVTGRMANRPAGVSPRRRDGSIEVCHPRWLSPPAVGKSLDGWLYARAVEPVARALHETRAFDLLDAHFAYPDGFAACRLGARLGLPVVVTLRGTLPDLAYRPSRRWALRRVFREAAAMVSVSAGLAYDARRLGVDPAAITVVPNGIDTETFRLLDRDAARRELGLPAGRPTVVSVGALREVKGHHHLLRAIARLRERVPDVLAVFVGGPGVSDDRSEALRRLAGELGIEDRVVWAGARPHAEIPVWLAAADVFALASRREGCCNALLEALACGRPVVATAVGGNPEIVSGPGLGRLVAPAAPQALAGALGEVLDLRWNPSSIRAAVADRGWERTAEAVERVWARAAGLDLDEPRCGQRRAS